MHKIFRYQIKCLLAGVLSLSLLASPVSILNVSAEEETDVVLEEEEASYAPDEIILVYEDAGVSKKESQEIQEEAKESLSENHIEDIEVLAEASERQGTVAVAAIPDNMDVAEAVEEASADENISYAQPNYTYQLMEEDTQKASESIPSNEPEYYLSLTHTLEAWDISKTQKKVTVAIFDTGCRMDHEDLINNVNQDLAYDVCTGRLLKDRKNIYPYGDATGHGTHVAGLVAAQADNTIGIQGTSYNAEILPIKIFPDYGGEATTVALYQAFQYCISHFDEINNLRIINLSIGDYSTDWDPLLEQTIDRMRYEYGVLCVCAGGNGINDQPMTSTFIPSDFSSTLSVTSLNKNGEDSTWSDYNADKDISAPGEQIKSTWGNGYEYKKGTSMSAPIVSGICALLWAKYPDLTVDEVVTAIKSSADPIPNRDAQREALSGSAGAINAKAALEFAGDMINHTQEKESIESAAVSLETTEYDFNGSYQKPEPVVKMGSRVLEKGQDYALTYSGNKNAGMATVCVTGIGAYTGRKSINFTIRPVKLQDGTHTITLVGRFECFYTGKEIKPVFTVRRKNVNDGGTYVTLKENIDYTVSYTNNIEAGIKTAKVIVTGKGNYGALNASGNANYVKGSFSIYKDFGQCKGTYTSTFTYTGKEIFPTVTIKDGTKTLIKDQDYTLTISNNKNVGNAILRADGIGIYKGALVGTVKILPKGTSISKLYRRSKGFQVKWKKQTTQTTGYQIQYSLYRDFKKAKTKTISKNTTTSKKISGLKKKKYYYVRVRAYKKVGSQYFYSGWSKTKRIKTK